jgi:hypothetical protein
MQISAELPDGAQTPLPPPHDARLLGAQAV